MKFKDTISEILSEANEDQISTPRKKKHEEKHKQDKESKKRRARKLRIAKETEIIKRGNSRSTRKFDIPRKRKSTI